jgi:hypothetical protein
VHPRRTSPRLVGAETLNAVQAERAVRLRERKSAREGPATAAGIIDGGGLGPPDPWERCRPASRMAKEEGQATAEDAGSTGLEVDP